MIKLPFLLFVLLSSFMLAGGCELADPDTAAETVTEPEQREEAAANANGDVGDGWRDGRTVGVIPATDNRVEWETLDVGRPTGLNQPGDAEWIIARIEGQGFTRLLIMTMDTTGGRDPSRILLEGPGGGFWDGRFSVPIPGVARWRVESSGGAMRVFLNGSEILSISGNYTVERAVMADSPPRGFIGHWREVQD